MTEFKFELVEAIEIPTPQDHPYIPVDLYATATFDNPIAAALHEFFMNADSMRGDAYYNLNCKEPDGSYEVSVDGSFNLNALAAHIAARLKDTPIA